MSTFAALLVVAGTLSSCSAPARQVADQARSRPEQRAGTGVTDWVYQLQGYRHDRLDALAGAHAQLAVIDLARDAHLEYFRPGEIRALRASGKKVLAYFEIGSIENFRPEYPVLRHRAPDLVLNRWSEWPDEFFVKYWSERWWRLVVRPRVDRAIRTGYDGVYLDTPLAYEEIPLSRAGGRSRDDLARAMVALIVRISRYAHGRTHRPFWIVPQNSPELRRFPGYTRSIDGIGMEELFYRATDRPCTPAWCKENLRNTRALRAADKLVLAVDYAKRRTHIRRACAGYRREGFAGYVTGVQLDHISPPCGGER